MQRSVPGRVQPPPGDVDQARLDQLATRIAGATGRIVKTVAANLNNKADLKRIETIVATDPGVTMLVNNAGVDMMKPITKYTHQLASADMPRREVTLSTGEKIWLDDQGYTINRAAPNRADRKLVFDNFWPTYKAFEGSLGTSLAAKVKGDIFAAKARNYKNSLQAALDGPNIPETVYRTLVAEANRGLPQLHRYFELRRRMLGLPVDRGPPAHDEGTARLEVGDAHLVHLGEGIGQPEVVLQPGQHRQRHGDANQRQSAQRQ